MKLFKTIFLFMLVLSAILYAHEPNKAYFEFWQESNELIVRAEFPWTLRIALLNAFPQLKESRSQEDFDNAIFAYFSKAILIKENNDNVKLLTVNQLQHEITHSVIYELVYGMVEEIESVSITNTCLHELYDDQKNYNIINLAGNDKFSIVTENNSPTFTLPKE